DLARLRGLGARDAQCHHTLMEVGLGLLDVEVGRQVDGARELPPGTLAAVGRGVVGCNRVSFAIDGSAAGLGGRPAVFRLYSRERGANDDVSLSITEDIDGWEHACTGRSERDVGRRSIEQALQIMLETQQLVERIEHSHCADLLSRVSRTRRTCIFGDAATRVAAPEVTRW